MTYSRKNRGSGKYQFRHAGMGEVLQRDPTPNVTSTITYGSSVPSSSDGWVYEPSPSEGPSQLDYYKLTDAAVDPLFEPDNPSIEATLKAFFEKNKTLVYMAGGVFGALMLAGGRRR